MKKRKIKKLEPCAMEVYGDDEVMLFDSLLSRTIGARKFCVRKSKKPKKYTFTFWATEAEQSTLEEAWDKVIQAKWEGVENVLLRRTEK